MKKGIKLLCVLSAILMMTGCAKINTTMTINDDKSMKLSIVEAVNEALYDNSDEEIFSEEDLSKAEKQGFKYEEYAEDDMLGYTFTKSIGNIDSISKDGEVIGDLGVITGKDRDKYLFSVKKGIFKNTYTAKLISSDVDYANEQADKNETEALDETEEIDNGENVATNTTNGAQAQNGNANATDGIQAQNANTANTTDGAQAQNANAATGTQTPNANAAGGDQTQNTTTNTQTTTTPTVNTEGVTTQAGTSSEINPIVNSDSALEDEESLLDGDLTDLLKDFNMTFTVNLPYAAISNNATSVENNGKTLVWDLLKFEEDNMQFQFELFNMTNIYIAGGVGALLLLIFIILIIRSIAKKHKKANSTDDTSKTGVPEITPTAPAPGPVNFIDVENQTAVAPTQPAPAENANANTGVPEFNMPNIPNPAPMPEAPGPIEPVGVPNPVPTEPAPGVNPAGTVEAPAPLQMPGAPAPSVPPTDAFNNLPNTNQNGQ